MSTNADRGKCGVHDYGPWVRPIGQMKVRQCAACGTIQEWAEHLAYLREQRDQDERMVEASYLFRGLGRTNANVSNRGDLR